MTAIEQNSGSMRPPITDQTDLALLRQLQRDGRQTNRSLAGTVGLAPSTTLNRVRELEQQGIISGYHAEVDLASLGRRLQALVFVRLRPKSDEIIERFLNEIWMLPETIAISLISGAEDVLIYLAVADAEQLQHIVINKISSFPEVFDERTSMLFEHRRKREIEPVPLA